jgi:uncharacterized protein (TIGR02996 family)
MSDRERFLAAIEADPYDLDARKVFADWLDEFGSDADAEEAQVQRAWTREKQDAIVWLTGFAADMTDAMRGGWAPGGEMTYSGLLGVLADFLDGGDHFVFEGVDTPHRTWSENEELWRNYELATGRSLGGRTPERPFSCSC